MTAVWYALLVLGLAVTEVIRPSAVLLGALVLTVGTALLSGVLLFFSGKATLTLRAPGVMQKGREFLVTWSVSRSGKLPIGQVTFVLEAENLLTGEVVRRRVCADRNGQAQMSSAFCGCISYRATKVQLFDLLGVWHRKLDDAVASRVVVMPDTFPALVDEMAAASSADESEEYAPDRRGDDPTEIYQVRDYVAGDSVQQIHWKLSGKLDHLVVRDPSCPEDHSLLVFVDRATGDAAPRCVDALMEAAVSVCQALSEAGCAYHLAWNEETIVQQEIATQEQLPEAIGALMKSKKPQSGLQGASLYMRTYGAGKVGRILYFATTQPDEWEDFSAGFGRLFVCSEQAVSTESAMVFTPDNVQEVMQYGIM